MTAEPWPGLWLELGGAWRALAFTTRPCPTAHHALHAFTSGLGTVGPLQVPTRGQLVSCGADVHRVSGDLLTPTLTLVDRARPARIIVTYDGPVNLPRHLTQRALQDVTRLGGHLTCSGRPDLPTGAHLNIQATYTLSLPRAVTGPAPALDLLGQSLRQQWWAAWQLRTEEPFTAAWDR